MTFYSPLRYPGGKGKISNYFKNLLEHNSLQQSFYVEPYAGGASVALFLLFNEYVNRIKNVRKELGLPIEEVFR